MPSDLEQAFTRIDAHLDRIEKSRKRTDRGTRKLIRGLYTLVVGHYADVHRLLRVHEREIARLKVACNITAPLPPDPDVPRALPNTP
jgi:hypothetical protein